MPDANRGESKASREKPAENVVAALRLIAIRVQQRRWERRAADEDRDIAMAVETGMNEMRVMGLLMAFRYLSLRLKAAGKCIAA